jgi:hypothetical protein
MDRSVSWINAGVEDLDLIKANPEACVRDTALGVLSHTRIDNPAELAFRPEVRAENTKATAIAAKTPATMRIRLFAKAKAVICYLYYLISTHIKNKN